MKIAILQKMKTPPPAGRRLLGLDLGTKTIGVAISDGGHSIATPLETIERRKFAQDAEALGRIVREYQIGGYILGWPLNMDGTRGARCDATLSFADEMARRPEQFGTAPWIALWDERLTTSAMHDFLIEEADLSRKRRQDVIDKMAARLILQGALDYLATVKGAGV